MWIPHATTNIRHLFINLFAFLISNLAQQLLCFLKRWYLFCNFTSFIHCLLVLIVKLLIQLAPFLSTHLIELRILLHFLYKSKKCSWLSFLLRLSSIQILNQWFRLNFWLLLRLTWFSLHKNTVNRTVFHIFIVQWSFSFYCPFLYNLFCKVL